MVIINKTEEGNITINRTALARIVVFEINAMSYCIELCNRKGKPIKKFILGNDENSKLFAIDILAKNGIEIRFNCLIRKGYDADTCINELFDRIEEHYIRLNIEQPNLLSANIINAHGYEINDEGLTITRKNGEIRP